MHRSLLYLRSTFRDQEHWWYSAFLFLSCATWFRAIRAPLWQDETLSFQQISGGIWQIWPRTQIDSRAYLYILWFATKVFGTSEVSLRLPSVFAMLGATYLMYRVAHELFPRDIAFVVTIVFVLNPVVAFQAIDARPYAFGVLAVNGALFCLLRLRNVDSTSSAAAFGFLCGLIPNFHYVFALILLPMSIAFLAIKWRERRALWRQFGIAAGAFAITVLPIVSGFLYSYRSRVAHVWEPDPSVLELILTIAPALTVVAYVISLIVAGLTETSGKGGYSETRLKFCILIGPLPLLALYCVSVATPIHIFVPRYRLAEIPGIALCWGFAALALQSARPRLLFCGLTLALATYGAVLAPSSNKHGYSWKDATAVANKNASADGATVLVCSNIPESNFITMPTGSAVKDSWYFSSLSYYKLDTPVIGLPAKMNEETRRVGGEFLESSRHKRFLVIGHTAASYTLVWLNFEALKTHRLKNLGTYDGFHVWEFDPR